MREPHGRRLAAWLFLIPALALLPALAGTARAQRHPTLERGLAAEKLYDFGELDHINLFTGNILLTLPVGPTVRVGGELSYGLTLVSNSKVWDFKARILNNQTLMRAEADKKLNAGFGWLLLLGGRLIPPQSTNNPAAKWLLQTADGGEHAFYSVLHESERGGQQVGGVRYTRDGSYLRMRELGSFLEVDFPDGRTMRFQRADGKIVQIRDGFGNFVTITHSGEDWTVTDSQRGTTATFKVFTAPTGIMDSTSLQRVVQRIEVPTFSGATASYTLTTANIPIERDCHDFDPATPAQITVPLLTGLSLPGGTSYALPAADYITTGCGAAGLPKKLVLPTLGRIEWTYQDYVYQFATHMGRPEDVPIPVVSAGQGVATRKLVNPDNTVHGTWTYQTAIGPTLVIDAQRTAVPFIKNTVLDPDGHRVERWFSTYPWEAEAGVPDGWKVAEFGLSLNRQITDGTVTPRYLSSRIHHRNGTLQRSSYARYEHDLAPTHTVEPEEPARYDLNRREVSSRTVYDDDSGRFADVDRQDFDGLGHYRTSILRGFTTSSPARTVTMRYNPLRGSYLPDATGGSFSLPPHTGPWMLEGIALEQVVQSGVTESTLYCFDPATGFVQRKRKLKNGTASEHTHDLLTIFTANAQATWRGKTTRAATCRRSPPPAPRRPRGRGAPAP